MMVKQPPSGRCLLSVCRASRKLQHSNCNTRTSSLTAQRTEQDSKCLDQPLFTCARHARRHLHSKGVIHRDVKPTNIFCQAGVAKIGDLGLATYIPSTVQPVALSGGAADDPLALSVGDSQMKLTDVGTFLYTSPEGATEVYDEKCDVFSLGVVRWLPSDGASHWPLMAPLIGL